MYIYNSPKSTAGSPVWCLYTTRHGLSLKSYAPEGANVFLPPTAFPGNLSMGREMFQQVPKLPSSHASPFLRLSISGCFWNVPTNTITLFTLSRFRNVLFMIGIRSSPKAANIERQRLWRNPGENLEKRTLPCHGTPLPGSCRTLGG